MKNTKNLCESFDLEEAMGGVAIDDANGVLNGVVLLTGNKESQNKTFYTSKALLEAQKRYEGAKMYIDHSVDAKGNRSIQDFGGIYKNVRMDGERLRADLHLLESKRSLVMSIAKMRPAGIGLSIKDRGHGIEKDGVFFVEGFAPKSAFSIDLVAEPSVNKDLFESTNSNEEDVMDYKSLTVDALTKERPDLIESVQNAGKAAILKELEEAKNLGKKSEMIAGKLGLLIESDFPKDISESVKKMIMADDISVETAKSIILGQKTLVESLQAAAKKGEGKAVVKGMGHRKDEDVEESAKDLPTDDEIASAFHR
jgi:hypothetical protein